MTQTISPEQDLAMRVHVLLRNKMAAERALVNANGTNVTDLTHSYVDAVELLNEAFCEFEKLRGGRL